LYRQKGDSIKMMQKAKQILDMPIKIRSETVDRIRAFAKTVIENKSKAGGPHIISL
jgi:hypothetical protein